MSKSNNASWKVEISFVKLKRIQNLRPTIFSTPTIKEVIWEEDYNGRIAWGKSFIKECNRKPQLVFAKDHISKELSWWHDFIFCDDSKSNISDSDGKVMVWQKSNEELKAIRKS